MKDLDTYKARIEEYLRGKGIDTSGTNIKCISGTHEDNNPSAAITEADRLKCFSCGFNEDIFGCAGVIIGKPGDDKENFKDQLADVKKTLGEYTQDTAPTKKQKKRGPTKFVSLLPEKARDAYTTKRILEMGEYVTKKTLTIPKDGWYPYYNEAGLIDIMEVRFFYESGEKTVMTFYFNGKNIAMKNYPVLLYNRHLMVNDDRKNIIIHEGVKTVDKADISFPDFRNTGWNGGGKKIKNIQGLELLKQYENIYLWPDDDQKTDKRTGELLPHNEQPGQKTMIELKHILEIM